jgi:hypothetical protein
LKNEKQEIGFHCPEADRRDRVAYVTSFGRIFLVSTFIIDILFFVDVTSRNTPSQL